ncbi:unnamed protein product [Heligmosomoides polygyrus]|uniref:Ricin B-type lectin domain-containing protein n=1 Tax=Heligmosomoides polygyrus TaxID=6339 RepID=A0A183GGK1_HELPZ|nr:unnamed protein product [Heligmosomoides polygyrus]
MQVELRDKSSPRQQWFFSRNHQVAGFYQRYNGHSGTGPNITIDVLTVKASCRVYSFGAGHMVPGDRPGPSVQMITNFMFPNKNGNVDYSSTANVSPEPPLSKFLGNATGRLGHLLCAVLLLRLLV